MLPALRTLLALFAAALFTAGAQAETGLRVVVSIKPIHSLVARVMEGVGTPELLVSGSASPHTYTLRPSDAVRLQDTAVVFWVGPELEGFLEKPVAALAADARVDALISAPGLRLLPPREGPGFAPDHHDANEAGHAHAAVDPHIWLDPRNAMALVTEIAATLSKADPANASRYAANAAKATAELTALDGELAASTTALAGARFVVFHDAYQYFETRYGLQASAAITLHPDAAPGAARVSEIRTTLAAGTITCAFAEPQFDNKLLRVLTGGTAVKTAVLDPVGAELTPGPALYADLLRGLAHSLAACLAG